jgi:hypothetical protein
VENRRIWLIIGGITAAWLVMCAAVCLIAGVLFMRSPAAEEIATQVEEAQAWQEAREQGPVTAPVEEAGTLDEQIALVQEGVSVVRGLEVVYDIPITFLTEEELRQQLEEEFFDDYSPEEARDDAIALSAFDLLDADFDLYGFYLDLYAEQVAGYFDPEEEAIYLISGNDRLSALDESTLAHELTHMLQDQHHDLMALLPDDDEWYLEHPDEALARSALAEGDASMTELSYLQQNMSLERIQELLDEVDELYLPVLDSAPDVINRDLMFPYLEGMIFVEALYDAGGYAAVDAAYADPPVSSEQILHPERYVDYRDDPQEVTLEDGLAVLGADYRLVYEQPLGEFYLILYLETQLYPDLAEAAADGWDGDRYAVYYDDDSGDLAMVLRTVWDDDEEAAEFYETFRGFGEAWADEAPVLDDDAYLTCWSASDVLCVSWDGGPETLVVRAPTMALAEGLLAQYAVAVP